jgi:hypothetical protein
LREFAATYAPRLELAASSPAPRAKAASLILRDRLGYVGANSLGLAQIQDDLARDGARPELRKTLPLLLPGIGAAAFHGLIRTAYAVEIDHREELAAGLSYWALRYLPLSQDLPREGAREVEDWLTRIEDRLAGWRAGKGLIFERMIEAAQTAAFGESVEGLRVAADTLQRLSILAVDRYLQTQDFTILHLITSCHALRLLMPWCEAPDVALRWYALAYAAALVASETRTQQSASNAIEAKPWSTLIERAVDSENEHVIKLVYTCRAEGEHYADDRYRFAATVATSN